METLFFKPKTQEEVLSLLAQYGPDAMIVNGGTDAVLKLINKKISPRAIIHVADLDGFHAVKADEENLYIGGGTTYLELLDDPRTAEFDGLHEAIMHLASPPVRNIATAAGNLCNAAPSADCTTMLLALGAKVHLVSASGERWVPVEEFFVGVNKTVCRPDELLAEIAVPRLKPGEGTGYRRLSRRKSQDIANVLVGVRLTLEDGKIAKIAISLGAMNAYAFRAHELESTLIGKTAAEAAEICRATFPAEAHLRDDYFKDYQLETACAAIARTVETAAANVKGAD